MATSLEEERINHPRTPENCDEPDDWTEEAKPDCPHCNAKYLECDHFRIWAKDKGA